MKAIKIDIKQETLDLEPRPYYLFHKIDKERPTRCVNENDLSADMVKMHIEEYRVFEFNNPYSKEKRINYLIKIKDKELVDNLVKIEQDMLDQKIYEETMQIKSIERLRIIKLSWLKRLFNKF